MASGLLDKANIILTPTGYKAGTMYNVAPIEQPYEDFVFSRASVASRVNSSGLVEMVGRTLGSNLVQNGDFSEVGSELVTDGDFPNLDNWSVNGGDYATIVDGALNSNNTENGNWHTENISQNISFVNGKTYKISFKAKNISGDPNLRLTQNGYVIFTNNITSSFVDYEVYYTANADNGSIRIFCNDAIGEFQIDNVSVQQVDPNDRWTLGTGWSIGDGKATSIGSNYGQQLKQTILQTNKIYKLSFDIVDYTSGNIALESVYYGVTQTFNGVGSYVTYFTSLSQTEFRLYSQNFIGSISNVVVQEIIDTNNIPRINYDSNGENGHWLLEPTSTNLITYSEDFNDSSWNLDFAASYITRTPNAATSPSGENNATKIIANDVSRDPNNSYIGASTSASAPYTASIFAKKGEYDYLVLGVGSYGGGYYAIFNLSNGTISTSPTASGTTASIEDYGNGWFRCIIATTNTSGSEILFTTPSVDGTLTTDYTNTTNGVYVWGAQLEELSYATSYIPTLTGSTETRATETATGAGSADLINSTEGVLYAEIAALADDGTYRYSISDGTNNNNIYIELGSSNISAVGRLSGVNQFALSSSQTITNTNKIALKYKANDFALWINGTEVAIDTSGSTYSANTLNSLQFDRGDGFIDFYGKCKALAVFNEALSDSELTELTS